MPITAHQLALQAESQVIQRNMRACKHIPQEGLACFRRGQQVFVIWRDGAVGQFTLENSSRICLMKAYLITYEFIVADQVVLSLHHEMILVEDMQGKHCVSLQLLR